MIVAIANNGPPWMPTAILPARHPDFFFLHSSFYILHPMKNEEWRNEEGANVKDVEFQAPQNIGKALAREGFAHLETRIRNSL